MIYYLPIEPLEERYTKQWYVWFPAAFEAKGLAYTVIDGDPLTDRVEVGTFLDINSTLHYKAEQLKRVARLFYEKQVKDGDVFFVADVEFWGIDAIRYLATLNHLNVKLCGFCHAGSYTREDFMEPCAPFACYYEAGWGAVFDELYVGSAYHKRQLVASRGLPEHKVVVTGNPYDTSVITAPLQESRPLSVVLTNRPDPEKRPGVTLDVFERLKRAHPDWSLSVTTSRALWGSGDLRARAQQLQEQGVLTILEGLSKAQYLKHLGECRVMTSNTIEENFGYCVLEALLSDTVVVVPDAFSHPELVGNDERCLFSGEDEQVSKIEAAVTTPFSVRHWGMRYHECLGDIVDLVAAPCVLTWS